MEGERIPGMKMCGNASHVAATRCLFREYKFRVQKQRIIFERDKRNFDVLFDVIVMIDILCIYYAKIG